ncbi:CoA transferase [Sphingobium baderi]|uniref:CoA transferase n=1 Tax=Sphingobium baderi TaxID=1332080 RepID=UPI00191C39BD
MPAFTRIAWPSSTAIERDDARSIEQAGCQRRSAGWDTSDRIRRHGAGPFCAMLLSDMGADVVRIDRSAQDD